MQLDVLHAAERDLEDAKDWYGARGSALPTRMTDEFEECLDAIAAGPSSFPNHPRIPDPTVRFESFRSFPYAVLFRTEPSETVVLAVVHERRGDAHLAQAAARS